MALVKTYEPGFDLSERLGAERACIDQASKQIAVCFCCRAGSVRAAITELNFHKVYLTAIQNFLQALGAIERGGNRIDKAVLDGHPKLVGTLERSWLRTDSTYIYIYIYIYGLRACRGFMLTKTYVELCNTIAFSGVPGLQWP